MFERTRGARVGLLLATLVCSPLACAVGGEGPPASVARVGTVQIALTSRSNGGVTYHLTNATFDVSGTSTATLSGDDPILRQDLPAGSYSIALEDGWALAAVAPDGSETVVPAQLVSSNPRSFTIQDQQITHLSFDFSVSGETIEMGDGRLSVAVNVDDGLIDDFEDGDDQILRIGGRNGGWFTFNDGTAGVIIPAPDAPALPTPEGPDGNLVLHVSGGGFSDFGAGFGASLVFDEALEPYDAAAYAGVSFSYASATPIEFEVGTVATTPPPAGTCDASRGICYDNYSFLLPASATFTTVEVTWDQMRQQGFGAAVPFDASQLLTVQWNFPTTPPYTYTPPPASFDVRVDDVKFMPASRAGKCSSYGESCSINPCCAGLRCDTYYGYCFY